jgi:phycocyanobilin lyase subunit beta
VTDSASIPALIAAVEQADSPDRLIRAVQALAAAHDQAAIPTLIAVLGYNNPGAAVIAVKGLVQIGSAAVEPLLLLDEYNYGARAYAIRALAAIADPRALEVLLNAAETDFAPSVRRAATKGVGALRWFQLPPESVVAAQARALQTLLLVSQDGDWSLRYAAVVGLEAMATAVAAATPPILTRLQQMSETENDRAVQARVRLALWHLSDQNPSGDPLQMPISTPIS